MTFSRTKLYNDTCIYLEQEQTLFKDLRRQDIEIKKDETRQEVRPPLKWIFLKKEAK